METLESRRLLATLVVDRTDDLVDQDPGDGKCEVVGGGCTLRAAIQEANALPNAEGPDFITLPPGTFALALLGMDEDQAITGDLDIIESVELRGAGSGLTTIDADAIDRVFDISRGEVLIRDLTVRGGLIVDDELSVEASGGGIRNEGRLTLQDTIVTGNAATIGAGVANYSGTLQIIRSVISGNGDLNTRRGGGIANESNYDPADLRVTDSTISGNQAELGGGVVNYSYDGVASATLERSTISGNMADDGAGIANESVYGYESDVRATLIVRNSTVSGNLADVSGGGIFNRGDTYSSGSVTIENSTIASNSAAGIGGGIHQLDQASESLELTSTIVANNQSDEASDLSSLAATATFSLVRAADGHSLIDGELGNIVGLNPLLGPLQDNGGPTATHLPETISPVVDRGTNASMLANDQRGSAFRRVIDLPLNGNASDGTDIGAVEIGQDAAETDFGDAPESVVVGGTTRNYPTSLDQDGARHRIVSGGPRLGSMAGDGEIDGQPNANADGDDLNGLGDEDAIDGPIIVTPGESMRDVTVQFDAGDSAATLNGWIDFNLDGDWQDPGEQILANVSVPAGVGNLTLDNVIVPSSATQGRSYLRLRISTETGLAPTGEASDGEVEDFAVTIGAPLPDVADLSLTQSVDNPNPSLGQQIELTIVVRNDGPDRATGVQVGTFLPFELVPISSTADRGRYDVLDEIWELGILASGESATLRIVVEVDSSDSISHTAEVIAADQDDPDSTPDNGIEAEDDQQTVSIGTCLARTEVSGGSSGVMFSCAAGPGAFVAFVRGTQRGQTRFENYDVTVDMADASVFATAIADANGIATVPLLVQENDVGETYLIQAFEIGPQRLKSNTLVIDVDDSDLPTFQTNLANPADVNNDGQVTALDALIVINRIESMRASGEESIEAPANVSGLYPDTNGDGRITASDALLVINRLEVDPTKIRR